MEKYHAMEHKYPSKIEIIEKYSYDSKQLHHLMRVENYLMRYIAGESYEACLIPDEETAEKLRKIKEDNGYLSLEQAKTLADLCIDSINTQCEAYLKTVPEGHNEEVEALLKEVQYEIMKLAVTMELVKGE